MTLRHGTLPDYRQVAQIAYDTLVATAFADRTRPATDRLRSLQHELSTLWLAQNSQMGGSTRVLLVPCEGMRYLFDEPRSRLVAAFGRSRRVTHPRDAARMQGLLGGGLEIDGRRYDKGHALAHSMGGCLDLNLFPQHPGVNRGHKSAYPLFREMERYAAEHPGTYVFSRMVYVDDGWIPYAFDYGLFRSPTDTERDPAWQGSDVLWWTRCPN
jgi:hypothetical protein